jgi:MOSC domain-containing protein YiiM
LTTDDVPATKPEVTSDSLAQIRSVNVGEIRTIEWLGRQITTAIWKHPVAHAVRIRRLALSGDQQADLESHGGADKAVYAYAREDSDWWQQELGRRVNDGLFGENLTVSGLVLTDAVIGERWTVGTAHLEVSQPRIPCYKLGIRIGDPLFPRRFAEAGRPGAYLRVIDEGSVAAGDPIAVVSRPSHGVTIGNVERAYRGDRTMLARLRDLPELPEAWHDWTARMLLHNPGPPDTA